MQNRIPVAGPSITNLEIKYVGDAVSAAWYDQANKYHTAFEQTFANYLGVRHAVCLPSCTSAIHLSLLALGIGPGDEVIVPDITWIASAAPLSYVGAQPVFADVDPETWCMSASSLEACITPRTKAIIPVDLYGGMPDLTAIQAIASEHNLPIIEDAAEAIGSTFHDQKAGSFGRTGVFSFHGSKTMTTGEGGMLTTNDEELFKRVLFLRDHGRAPGDVMFNNIEVAHKYKMSSMQAALGLAQIERAEELVFMKRRIFEWYKEGLAGIPDIKLNHELPNTRNSYWMSTLVVGESYGLNKTAIMAHLNERSIDSRPFFNPLSSIPAYESTLEAVNARRRNHVSYSLSTRGINLPSALSLTSQDVTYVCNVLRDFIKG